MKQHAKAVSAGSTQASGSARGPLRRALATRAASRRAKGMRAPTSRRLRATLAVLALAIAAFGLTAASASADTAEMGAITEASYASAHVKGKITAPFDFGAGTSYSFEYCAEGIDCTDNVNWTPGLSRGPFFEVMTNKEVEGTLAVPKSATKYFVRLTTSHGAVSPAPNPSFTTLAADPTAVVTIDNASEVAYTTAKATGRINRPVKSNDVACHFEYITDAQFTVNEGIGDPGFQGATSIGCEPEESVSTTGGEVPVEAKLNDLANGTTYHLRLAVSNAASADAKEAPTFTTLTVDPPSVKSIDNATEVEYTQAQVKGVVERPANADPAFDIDSCNFEYVTDQQYNENPTGEEFAGAVPVACEAPESPIHAAGETNVKATLAALSASTTYHLRLAVSNKGGSDSQEAAATFTTLGPIPKPTVTAADDASEVKYNSAVFTGKVLRPAGKDPALDTNCRFEYVTQAQFEAEEFAAAAPNGQIADCTQNPITADKVDGSGEIEVRAKTGLFPETTYHLRLVAENAGGSDAKDATTFTTPEADLPTVTIDPIEDGVFTTAHVTGTVTLDDGYGAASTPFLQVSSDGGATWGSGTMLFAPTFGPSQGEFNSAPNATMQQGDGLYIVKADVTGLAPSTTYLFRIAASYNPEFTNNPPQNIALYEERGEVGFSSEPYPSITTEPPQPPPTADDLEVTDVTATSAHFSGEVDPHAPAGTLSGAGKKAFATHWEFVCVPECKDKNENPIEGTVQGEEGAQTVTGDVKRLEPGTEYTVSLVVSSEGGTDTEEKTFPTAKIPPSVKQAPGSSDGAGGYTLQGVVNPNNETITDCEFRWGPASNELVFKADCSPQLPDPGAKPTTVEAHLTSLNTGVDYYSKLVVTYAADPVDLEADSGPAQKFRAELAAKEPCPGNEQVRIENDSLALPECRAYEMVSPPGKEGWGAQLEDFYGGVRVFYRSGAGNIARSGQSGPLNYYVAARSATGWETIPNLNGSGGGTIGDAPSDFAPHGNEFSSPVFYSEDLLSSVWNGHRLDGLDGENFYLREPDGLFTLLGLGGADFVVSNLIMAGASDDLSHVFFSGYFGNATRWGKGVYEYVGTGNEQPPRRADVDNQGSPITACEYPTQNAGGYPNAGYLFNSGDGRVFVIKVKGGCGGANPPADQVWARVDGTTSFEVSASQCNRGAGDPNGPCNAPAQATFAGAAKDGSRIFFMTTQQLVDGDIDQTNDLYACDLPSGDPAPVGEANSCASLTEVSGSSTEARVEPPLYLQPGYLSSNPGFQAVSGDGSTVLFTAKGVLADNEDALKEEAVAGDHNLYLWRTDGAHPDGQTTFVGRLDSNDLSLGSQSAQSTPDGRYLVFATASRLLDTDTDSARDVYRYDADTGLLIRVSTNVFGVAGNGDFNAQISDPSEHHPTTAISDDGQKIIFTTSEPLNLAVDGNEESDVYLWTPARVSLISAGSVGSGGDNPAITASGQDIYFQTPGALTPADGDDLADVYDARIGGGFSFAEAEICVGEKCQSDPVPALPTPPSPANTPNGEGNVKPPKPCPKGKVRKKNGKCVKKPKKHSGKKHRGKKAAHKQGGGK